MIKHISLDFWNTIGIPNPEFSKIRTAIISKEVNLSEETVKCLYTGKKTELDRSAERNGTACSTSMNWTMLVHDLFEGQHLRFGEADIIADRLERAVVKQFFEVQPLIDKELILIINKLQEKGITFNISSNTNFISGFTISTILNMHGFFPNFELYSDIIGYSKPHATFFNQVFFNATRIHNKTLNKDNILHIGDSAICDAEGASKFGFKTHMVNTTFQTLSKLKEFI